MGGENLDEWAGWVLSRSHAGDAAQKRRSLDYLEPIRDRVLTNAQLGSGHVALDVGTGDGLIGFGAIPLVGDSGRVIFSDVSADLLAHCRAVVEDAGWTDRAQFVRASAEDLRPIRDGSVDVVTTRSVLIYVHDKARAFREFHRVLRRAGRLSIFEPINNYFPDDMNDFWGFDARPVRDLVEKIWAYEGWNDTSFQDDPMMNFDEHDLLRLAEGVGFCEVHVELVLDVEPGTWVEDWERLLGTAPNPHAHTAGEAISGALTPEEARRFETHLRPLVDTGQGVKRSAFAYLWAVK